MTNTEQKLIRSLDLKIDVCSAVLEGRPINYVVCGAGRPLILVHGGTFGWGMWYANLPQLAKHFKVYAVDLPGGGNSPEIDYKDFPGNFKNFLASFILENNIIRPDIIGHSFGGWIALQAAMTNSGNIGRLVLVDSTGFSKQPTVPDQIMSFYPLAGFLAKTLLRPTRGNVILEKFLRNAFCKKDVQLSAEFIDYYYETMQRHHNLKFISRLISFHKDFYAGDILAGVFPPTMVVWGRNDPIMPLELNLSNIKKIKNARIEIIDGTGHVPPQEKSDEFNKLIINFLNP